MASAKTIAVLDATELHDGQMKEVDFDEGKVLLSKIGENVHATSAFCTHYGAPLAKGVLVGSGRVTCPWHGACFDVTSGDIEDAPGPAAIHKFETSIKNGKIYVTADPSCTTKGKKSRTPASVSTNASSKSTSEGVVIVGGGAGAIATIVGLRESGYTGSITALSAEPHAPIDRTKLSKALVTDPSALEWYSLNDIKDKFGGAEVRTGVHVESVDTSKKTVTLESSEIISYGKLVLATGALPKRLPIPGKDLPHVFVLRSVDDAKKIDSALGKGKRLVIIGSSFIGMELSAAVQKYELGEIHVVGMTKYPFEPVLGTKVGAALRKFHESKGVVFHGEAKTTAITAKDVTIEYDSGDRKNVNADVVVMAVGVGPATQFLKGSGIKTAKDGGVEVDNLLKVKGVEDVYAIGDIAIFPEPTTGQSARIEHWNVAQNHGRAVASGIAGKEIPFDKTPVFWSAQGQQLRYVGYGAGFDEVFIKGDIDALKFIAYYLKEDKVLAVASMQSDPVAMKCSELMRLGRMPSATEIKGGKDPLSIDISSAGSARR